SFFVAAVASVIASTLAQTKSERCVAYTRQTAGSTPTTTGVVRRRYKQLPAGPETSPNFLALYVAQLIKACLLFVRQQPVEGLQFRLHDLDGIEHHAEPLLH